MAAAGCLATCGGAATAGRACGCINAACGALILVSCPHCGWAGSWQQSSQPHRPPGQYAKIVIGASLGGAAACRLSGRCRQVHSATTQANAGCTCGCHGGRQAAGGRRAAGSKVSEPSLSSRGKATHPADHLVLAVERALPIRQRFQLPFCQALQAAESRTVNRCRRMRGQPKSPTTTPEQTRRSAKVFFQRCVRRPLQAASALSEARAARLVFCAPTRPRPPASRRPLHTPCATRCLPAQTGLTRLCTPSRRPPPLPAHAQSPCLRTTRSRRLRKNGQKCQMLSRQSRGWARHGFRHWPSVCPAPSGTLPATHPAHKRSGRG